MQSFETGIYYAHFEPQAFSGAFMGVSILAMQVNKKLKRESGFWIALIIIINYYYYCYYYFYY